MAFDPITWATSFIIGKAANKLSDLIPSGLGTKLEKDVRYWSDGLPNDLACSPGAMFPDVEDEIFLARVDGYKGIMELKAAFDAKRIPTEPIWMGAFIDKWWFVIKTKDERQPFFDPDRESEVKEHLMRLAGTVTTTCAADETLFRITIFKMVEALQARERPSVQDWDEDAIASAQQRLQVMPIDQIPEPAPLPPGSLMPLSRNDLFVGRTDELKRLAISLKEGTVVQVAATTGIGGIGKTQLAATFVHRYGQFFKGGVYWLSFEEAENVKAEIVRCGLPSGMDLFSGDQLEIEQQVQKVLTEWQKPIPRLLVFDNCESEELFDEWRPNTGGCRILVTSRLQDWAPSFGVKTVSLGVLSEVESLALLKKFYLKDEAGLAEIAEELGHLPLALHLAGSYLKKRRSMTPQKYLEQIRSEAILDHPSLVGKVGTKISPTGHILHVGRTFSMSFDLLDEKDGIDKLAIDLLQSAACFAPCEAIPYELFVDFRDEDAVDDGIDRLVQLGLLEAEENAVKLHRLLVAFVEEVGIEEEVRSRVEGGVLDKADVLNNAGYPGPLLEWQIHLKTITDEAVGRGSEFAGSLCNTFGCHLNMIAAYSGAKPYLEQALTIYRRDWGEHHPSTGRGLVHIGLLLHNMGDLSGACSSYEEALGIFRKSLGEDHPNTATSLNNLGNLHENMGDFPRARLCYEQALTIRRKVVGIDHPDTASSLNSLGHLLQAMGDYPAAWPYYEESQAIYCRSLGKDHPTTAANLSCMAALLKAMGDLPGAMSYTEEALAIFQKVFGEGHPTTATILHNLGALLKAMGDLPSARPYYEQALAIRRQTLGNEHPDTARSFNDLGALLQAMGDLPAAKLYHEQALIIRMQILGKDHSDTARSLNNLGHLLKAQGDLCAAQQHLEQALAIRREVLGEDHPDTAESLNNLGVLFRIMGDLFTARHFHEQALAIRVEKLGEDHPDTATSLGDYANLLLAMGEFDRAKSFYEKVLSISQKSLGPDHPWVAISLNNLGTQLLAMGDLPGSKSYYEQALATFERALGEDHPDTKKCKNSLGFLYKEMKSNPSVLSRNREHQEKVGRNDLCPCTSGVKYKKCCLRVKRS